MDRIDSYIRQAFAKFQDVPEIQAQQEEMADHLRDRIADAMGQGKSEKEAFDAATRAMSDAMPDLEQTLAGYLRPEFRPESQTGKKPKPHTKEIYINFYRYHRAMMLMFVQVLFTLVVVGLIGVYGEIYKQWERWTGNLTGIAFYFNLFMGIFVIWSVAVYHLKPLHTKRVSAGVWELLAKYGIGFVLITAIVLIQWYATIFPDDHDAIFQLLLIFLLFYSVSFILFSCLGWFRQQRYTKAPDIEQDTPLARWGLMLTGVCWIVILLPLLISVYRSNEKEYRDRPYQEGLQSDINRLQQELGNCSDRLENAQRQLNAEMGPSYYIPSDGRIHFESMPMLPGAFPTMPISPIPMIPTNYKGQPILKKGMWADIFDPDTRASLWRIHGENRDYKIIDTEWRFQKMSSDMVGGGMAMMGGGMAMMSGGMGMSGGSSSSGMGGFGGGSIVPPEPIEHQLTLDSDFPATDLAENVICAREFPFEEYKLGMIQAVAPETVAGDESFPLRLGVGNLDAKNAKLLLTVEYDDGLQQADIPSGATLFLGFVGSHEYREYKVDFTVQKSDAAAETPESASQQVDSPANEHTIRLTLRNESGQVIAETQVVVVSG